MGHVRPRNMRALPEVTDDQRLIVPLLGTAVTLLPEGAIWLADHRLLVVSDLHFEKGSSYAARGQMLPPYDTAATLSHVEALVSYWQPDICISLGDSFHDKTAEDRLDDMSRARIKALTSATDWVWVEGNHDPNPPASLGGRAERTLRLGSLVFRHEPTGEAGEVAGHLHPVAKVKARGQAVRRKCFVTDGRSLVMPALGALTGGLNVLDVSFAPLFPNGFQAHALGRERVHPLASKKLVSDNYVRR